jgi:fermentation-respiration switch protein FrsA (DUF1100 family)
VTPASSLLTLVGGLALGYLVLLGGMYAYQRGLLYHPDRSAPAAPITLGLVGMEEVWLKTEDGLRLNAWYAPPAPGKRGVLLYLHGNAGNLASLPAKLSPYLGIGLGVLALDWRGYGKSEGSPTEEGLYADGRAALAFLAGLGVPVSQVVLHGESLGSGVATQLAVETGPAGVILEAPYLSVAEAAQFHYPYLPARWLVKDRFDNLVRIGAIRSPILILHGDLDQTVPVSHGRALLAAAGPEARGHFFPQAGHANLFDFGAQKEVQDFIRRIFEAEK